MLKKFTYLVFFICCFFASSKAFALRDIPQDSSFYSIESAKENPAKVALLVLDNKGLTDVPEEVKTFSNLKSLLLKRVSPTPVHGLNTSTTSKATQSSLKSTNSLSSAKPSARMFTSN